MKELLYAIVEGLVEDKSAIRITEDQPDEKGVIVFHLSVAPDDMGRVIGKKAPAPVRKMPPMIAVRMAVWTVRLTFLRSFAP